MGETKTLLFKGRIILSSYLQILGIWYSKAVRVRYHNSKVISASLQPVTPYIIDNTASFIAKANDVLYNSNKYGIETFGSGFPLPTATQYDVDQSKKNYLQYYDF